MSTMPSATPAAGSASLPDDISSMFEPGSDLRMGKWVDPDDMEDGTGSPTGSPTGRKAQREAEESARRREAALLITASGVPYHPFVMAGRYHAYRILNRYPVPGGAVEDDKRRRTRLATELPKIHADADELAMRGLNAAEAKATAAAQREEARTQQFLKRMREAGAPISTHPDDERAAAEAYKTKLAMVPRWPREEGGFPASKQDTLAFQFIKERRNADLRALFAANEIAVNACEPSTLNTALMVGAACSNDEAVMVSVPKENARMHLFRRKLCQPCLQLYLENGADTRKLSATGTSALHCVWDAWSRVARARPVVKQRTLNEMTRIVAALLRYGADVNAPSASGITALHLAAKHDHGGIASLLLKGGADETLIDSRGQSATDTARSHNATNVLAVLTNWPIIAKRRAGHEQIKPVAARQKAKTQRGHPTKAAEPSAATLASTAEPTAAIASAKPTPAEAEEDVDTLVKVSVASARGETGETRTLPFASFVQRWHLYEHWMMARHKQRELQVEICTDHKRPLPPVFSQYAQFDPATGVAKPVDLARMFEAHGDPHAARKVREALQGSDHSFFLVNDAVMRKRLLQRRHMKTAQKNGFFAKRREAEDNDDAASVEAIDDGGGIEAADLLHIDEDEDGAAAAGHQTGSPVGGKTPWSTAVVTALRQANILPKAGSAAAEENASSMDTQPRASAPEAGGAVPLDHDQVLAWKELGLDRLLVMSGQVGYGGIGKPSSLRPAGEPLLVVSQHELQEADAQLQLAEADDKAAARARALPPSASPLRILDSPSRDGKKPGKHASELMVKNADGTMRLLDPKEVAKRKQLEVTEDDLHDPLATIKRPEGARNVLLAVAERRAQRKQYNLSVRHEPSEMYDSQILNEASEMAADDAGAVVPTRSFHEGSRLLSDASALTGSTKSAATVVPPTGMRERRARLAAQLVDDAPTHEYADRFTRVISGNVFTRRPAVTSPMMRAGRARLEAITHGRNNVVAALGTSEGLRELVLGK